MPRIRPSRGTHVMLRHEDLPLVGGAIVPAGGGRSIFALPWHGHTLVGTTDNDYEEDGSLAHIRPSTDDVDYLLAATNEFFATDFGPGDLTGAFAGVRPLISTRRPEEVGRHLAQGGAVRDLLGDDHDHRRQAHDVAADGEDDGRPARGARRARRAMPHPRDPARSGDRRRRAAARGGRAGGLLPRARRALRPRRPRRARARSRARRTGSARSSRAARTCSRRSRSRPATSRRARSATCSCDAPAWGCCRRAS